MDDMTEALTTPILKPPFMIRLVLATGLVTSSSAAQRVLLAFALAAILIAAFLLFTAGGGTKGLSTQDVERIIQLQAQSGVYQ